MQFNKLKFMLNSLESNQKTHTPTHKKYRKERQKEPEQEREKSVDLIRIVALGLQDLSYR